MALKTYEPGDVVFLKLEGDFVPAWRQGLVASVSRKKGTIYLVVRVLDKELENKESGLTSFDLEQNKFILVQGSAKKLRSQCGASTHRALEVNTKMLLEKAVTVLSEGDLQWVTASEDLEESHKPVTKHLEPSDEESDSSGESGDSGEDILKLLKPANRTQPVGATGSENVESSRSKSKGRFVLLEGRKKHSKDEEKIDMDGLIMKSLAGAASSGDVDLNALLQMQILKQLQGKKGKKKDSLESAESSGSSEEDSSSEEKVRLKGAGKALKAYRQTQSCHEEAAVEAREKIRARDQRAVGGHQRDTFFSERLVKTNQLGKKQVANATPLWDVRSARDAPQRQIRTSSIATDKPVEGDSSVQSRRWQLEGGVAPNASCRPPGPSAVRGGGAKSRDHCFIRTCHGGSGKAQQVDGQLQPTRSWTRSRERWKERAVERKERKAPQSEWRWTFTKISWSVSQGCDWVPVAYWHN